MPEVIELIVVFKHMTIRRQLFGANAFISLSDDTVSTSAHQMAITVSSQLVQTIYFDRKLMSCIDYRRKVFTNLKQRLNTKCQTCDTTHRDHSSANTVESDDHQMPHLISLSVELQSMDHYLVIDKIWNRCLQELVTIRFRVEESFSWLSTLGGAYSSLGEYDITFAIKAGQISKSQLLLASITGDPNIVAKCGVFMAYSLCQQHRQPEAIQLIRRTLHPFIIRIEFCEQTVKSMFSALCYRIKHYYK